jgi:hypothetical protein
VAPLSREPELLESAVGYALAGAGMATPQLLSRPTPCPGWDLGYYPILDRAPKGRDEGDGWQLWIRRHDEYVEDSPPASPIGGRLLRSGRGDR